MFRNHSAFTLRRIWGLIFVAATPMLLASTPCRKALIPRGAAQDLILALGKLTEEKVDAALEALFDIRTTVFTCEDCGLTAMKEGECLDCEIDLVEDLGESIVDDAEIDEKGNAQIYLASNHALSLKAVEAALKEAGISSPIKNAPILPWTKIIVSSKKGDFDQEKINEALKPFFATIEITPVPEETKLLSILPGVAKPGKSLTLTELKKALKPTDVAVVDLNWSGPCARCYEGDAAVAHCQGCWDHRVREASFHQEDEEK